MTRRFQSLATGKPVGSGTDIGKIKWVVIVLLAADFVLSLVAINANATVISEANNSWGFGQPLAVARDNRDGIEGIFIIAYVLTGIAFIVWLREAYRNATGMGANGLRYDRNWTIFSWVIPLANLVLPKLIVDDVWKASDPYLPADAGRLWTEKKVPWWVHVWWLTFIGSNVVWTFVIGNEENAATTDDVVANAKLLFWAAVARAVAALLAIALVWNLTRRQSQRAQKVGAPQDIEQQVVSSRVGLGAAHPEWRSLTTPASILRILFIVWIVLQGAAIVADLMELRLLDRAFSVTISEAEANRLRQGTIVTIQLVLTVITGIIFIAWFSRAYSNLPALGAHRLRTKKGWAIGAWFVPLLNLIRPKQMADDIWRASHPNAPRTFEWVWHEIPVDPVVHIWWGVWLLGGFIGQLVATLPADSLPEVRRAVWLDLAVDLCLVVAAIYAIKVVGKITHREQVRGKRLAQPESPPPPPPPLAEAYNPSTHPHAPSHPHLQR